MADAARTAWNLEISERAVNHAVIVRTPSPYGYGRASYELNLGCNYDCEHCYLGLKTFSGLSWPERERLLHIMSQAGVLWVQLTGGEPLIDRLFSEVYQLAYELGLMISISSNGSRLSSTKILELLTTLRPYRLTLSVYGATAESYDGLTRRRGSFAAFAKGLAAAHEAKLPITLNLIVARHNAHEVDQMSPWLKATACRTTSSPTWRRRSTEVRKACPPSPSSTCVSASRSPAATPATRSFMWTRTAWPASAR
ncbi:MAG: radical SAM protein [Pseudonocardiaceae bacterium]